MEPGFEAVKGQRYGGYSLYDLGKGAPVSIANVMITSDNEAVALWESSEIVTKQVGTAKLIFAAPDSVKAYMTVNVRSVPGTTEFVNGNFTWSIDNTAVAEVTEKGVVKPKAAGKAVLRVTPKNADSDEGAPYRKRRPSMCILQK